MCYYGHGSDQPGSSDEVLSPTWELFDLDADPYELRSVHDDPAYAANLTALREESPSSATTWGCTAPD